MQTKAPGSRKSFIKKALALGLFSTFGTDPKPEPKKRFFRFAQITDAHIRPGNISETEFAKALQAIQTYKKVGFIINTGDSIMDALAADKAKTAGQWALFHKTMATYNKLPVYNCIGNHDIWGWHLKEDVSTDPDYGKAWALRELKMSKSYYSFTRDRWKFIVLDSVQNNLKGGYIGHLDKEQLDWLQSELDASKDYFICIASHIPILSICAALFFKKNEANGDHLLKRNLMHSDFFILKDLFKQHSNIKCCISGHIHLVDEVDYLGIRYFCNGAISGNWWDGSFQEFAPAFAIMDMYEDGTVERKMVYY